MFRFQSFGFLILVVVALVIWCPNFSFPLPTTNLGATQNNITANIVEMSARDLYLALVKEKQWKEYSNNDLTSTLHVIQILDRQIIISPKPFLVFNVSKVPTEEQSAYYDMMYEIIEKIQNPLDYHLFLTSYVNGYTEPVSCCGDDDEMIMIGWSLVEEYYYYNNISISEDTPIGNDYDPSKNGTQSTGRKSARSRFTNSKKREFIERVRRNVLEKGKRKTSAAEVKITQKKSQLSGANFNVKMGETHWMLDQYWTSKAVVAMSPLMVDHLFLNLKNALYLGYSTVNNSLSVEDLDVFTFDQMFKSFPTPGASTFLVLNTSVPIDSSTVESILSSGQINEISDFIQSQILETMEISNNFSKNYGNQKLKNAKSISDMRNFHNSVIKFIQGFGYIDMKTVYSLETSLAHAKAIYEGDKYSYPMISHTNYFYWKAVHALYNKGAFNTMIDDKDVQSFLNFNSSTPFSVSNMISLYQLLSATGQSVIADNFLPTTQFSSYNRYIGMYHYNYVDSLSYFIYKDVMLYAVMAIAIIFYLGLLVTFIINRKSGNITIRRRFMLPFIGPFCFFALPLYFTEPVWNYQYISIFRNSVPFTVTVIYPNMFISLFFATYCVTVLRFYYLKNLYWLMNKLKLRKHHKSTVGSSSMAEKSFNETKKKSKSLKFHKIMVSKPVAVLATIVLTIITFAVWLAYYFNVYNSKDVQTFSAYNMQLELLLLVPFASLVILLSFICIICLVVDLIANRKSLKQKGIVKFFLQDPFFLRFDLLVMFFVAALGCFIYMGLGESTVSASKALMFVLFALCYLVVGGNVIIYELTMSILHFIKYKSFSPYSRIVESEKEKSEFEVNIKDNSFRKMFRNYSVSEYSVENLELYEELERLSKHGSVSLQDMRHFDEQFMQRFSAFEVNIPASCRKQFYALLEKAEQEGSQSTNLITVEDFKNIFLSPILMNILDTYSRMEFTGDYRKWKATKDLQKEIEL